MMLAKWCEEKPTLTKWCKTRKKTILYIRNRVRPSIKLDLPQSR